MARTRIALATEITSVSRSRPHRGAAENRTTVVTDVGRGVVETAVRRCRSGRYRWKEAAS